MAAALVVVAAMVIGQAILAISGRREWSWLAPGVGLAALLIIGAATVRLPGRSTTAAIVIALVSLAAARHARRSSTSMGNSLCRR